jgi:hypothetical protein
MNENRFYDPQTASLILALDWALGISKEILLHFPMPDA